MSANDPASKSRLESRRDFHRPTQRRIKVLPPATDDVQLGFPVTAESERKDRLLQEKDCVSDTSGHWNSKSVGRSPFEADAGAESW